MLNTIHLDEGQLVLLKHAAERADGELQLAYPGRCAPMAGHDTCLGLDVTRDEDAVIFEAVVGLRDPSLYGILTARRTADSRSYPCTIYWPGVITA
jgi:hypothetical protein